MHNIFTKVIISLLKLKDVQFQKQAISGVLLRKVITSFIIDTLIQLTLKYLHKLKIRYKCNM